MKAAAFDYRRVETLRDAAALLAETGGNSRVLAGGQSLGPMLNLRLARPGMLIDIKRAADFRSLASDEGIISIGAGWTHAEIEDGAIPDATGALMRFVASGIAYRAVRNRGTLGGSLAHADPAADWIALMAGIGASIVAVGADGKLARFSADSFVDGAYRTKLNESQVLIAVEVPRLSAGATWGYCKIARKVGEFASAIGVAIHDPQRGIARVLAGAADGPPVVLTQTGARLRDKDAQAAVTAVADEIETAMADHDKARRALYATAVIRALRQLNVPRESI
ncbi:MAG: FAD binding domain-containing protein [Methylobacteriaceae bacterium]|nr:FAD binding domain-containing protein [Methylobacteriaceae bacterium]